MEKTRPEQCKCLKMCCRVHIKWAWTELKGSCEKFFWLELSKKKNETKHFQFLTVVILSFSYFQLNVYLKWFTSLWCWIVANLCTTLNKSIVKYVHSEEIAVTSTHSLLKTKSFLETDIWKRVQSIYRRWILAPYYYAFGEHLKLATEWTCS